MKCKILYGVICIVLVFSCKNVLYTEVDLLFDKSGMMLLPLTVNDSVGLFLFDTGSSESFLCNNDVWNFALAVKDTGTISFPSKDILVDCMMTELLTVKIGSLVFKKKIKFGAEREREHILTSIIGNNIISQVYWLFDFEKEKALISNLPLDLPGIEKWIKLPYQIKEGGMTVRVVVNETVDLGEYTFNTRSALYTPDSLPVILTNIITCLEDSKKASQEISAIGPTRYVKTEKGLSKNGDFYLVFCDSLKMFGHTLVNSAIFYQKDTKWYPNGLKALTLSYARQFRQMYLDTHKQLIYFKP